MKKNLVIGISVILLLSCFIAPAPAAENNYGTGLVFLTDEELAKIPKYKPPLLKKYVDGAPAAVDHSEHIPTVGHQGDVGSCVTWAIGYYYKCFLENEEEGWARSADAVWDTDELCSPSFLYNQINEGQNQATSYLEAMRVLTRMGIVSWADMPYSDDPFTSQPEGDINFTNLPTKQNYLDAMQYRSDTLSQIFSDYPDDTEVQTVKDILAGGNLAVISIYTAGDTPALSSFDAASHCVHSQVYNDGGHGQLVVGYDDNFNGDTHGCPGATGAFRIVNSWGEGWGDSGYYWMTYEGFKNNARRGYTMTDKIGYIPTVFAEVDTTHPDRGDIRLEFGVGTHSEPTDTFNLFEDINCPNDERDNISMWVDLTDLAGHYPPNNSDNTWFVRVSNSDPVSQAEITNFKISKNSRETNSYDEPVTVPTSSEAYADIYAMEVFSITPSYGPVDAVVNITVLSGKSFSDVSIVKLEKAGEADIAASSVVVADDETITCTFDLAGAAGGEWDVTVENTSDNTSYTMPVAFSVVAGEPAPPVQYNWSPEKGSTLETVSPEISYDTNENAWCRWSLSDLDYDTMTEDCAGEGTASHSCQTDSLVTGSEYVYISCRDTLDNKDTSASNENINYTVKEFQIVSIAVVDSTTIDVEYNLDIDSGAGIDVAANYFINGGIGVPTATEIRPDNRTLRLTIAPLDECTRYSLTISNVFSNGGIPLGAGESPAYFLNGGGTTVTTDISSNSTWSNAGTPYCLYTNIVIREGFTLDINQGTEVRMAPGFGVTLIVEGGLFINGTDVEPVIITSQAAEPESGDWNRIQFSSNAMDSSTVEQARISYAEYGLYINDSNPTIEDSDFSYSSYRSIYTANSDSIIRNNTISNNTSAGYGIKISGGSPVIEGNTLSGCAVSAGYCIYTEAASTAVIRNNRIYSSEKGIRLSSPATVAGNDLDGLTARGIGIETGGESAVIKDNNIRNCVYGISNFSGSDADATHNYFNSNSFNIGSGTVDTDYPLSSLVDRALVLSSIVLKTDGTYSADLGADIYEGSTLYIQLNGTDADPTAANETVVRIYSDTTDTTGVYAILTETAMNSGLYRGTALVAAASDQSGDPVIIGATPDEVVTIVSVRDSSISDNVTILEDTTPPAQSNWDPAKSSIITTTLPTITFDTNETADCKWSDTDQAYDDMTAACAGGTLNHSCSTSGLGQGSSTVYIACLDDFGNGDTVGTNELIEYFVDSLPPSKSAWNPAKSSTISTTSPTITLTLNENGDCKWSLTDQAYDAMAGDCTGDGTTSQSCPASGLSEGAEIVYVACRDTLANKDTIASNEHVDYTVDTRPPPQSAWNPAKSSTISTTSPTITLTLNENGDCKWSLTDQAYDAMAGDCTGDGTTSQSCPASGLSEGAEIVYVACRDTLGNKDTVASNEHVDYTVDTRPPPQSAWNPAKSSTISTTTPTITFTTDENADCKWSLTDEAYGTMAGDCTGDGTTSQRCETSGLIDGPEILYIACRDTVGNEDTIATNEHVDYTVDTSLPVQSNWNPAKSSTIATNSPTITFDINKNGDCKWSLTDQAYDAMAGDCTGDGTTSQSCPASGLSEGAEIVYVACRDTLGNKDTVASNEHVDYTVDTAPPTQSAWNPAKGATITTTSPTITLTLNENGDCKWSLTDQAYDAMAGDCTGDGTTSQSCPASGLSEGAEIVYVACRDALENEDTVDTNEHVNYTVEILQLKTTIVIEQGWNLAGISEQNISLNPEPVFGESSYEIVGFASGLFEYFTDDETVPLEFAYGYWIFSENEIGEIALTGTDYTDSSYDVNLSAGWNLFSSPFIEAISWADDNASLVCGTTQEGLVAVYFYNSVAGYSAVEPNTGSKIMPWNGYWIRTEDDCTLTLSK